MGGDPSTKPYQRSFPLWRNRALRYKRKKGRHVGWRPAATRPAFLWVFVSPFCVGMAARQSEKHVIVPSALVRLRPKRQHSGTLGAFTEESLLGSFDPTAPHRPKERSRNGRRKRRGGDMEKKSLLLYPPLPSGDVKHSKCAMPPTGFLLGSSIFIGSEASLKRDFAVWLRGSFTRIPAPGGSPSGNAKLPSEPPASPQVR